MKEEYLKWYSKHLERHVELLVFGHSGYPVVLFPTSTGSFYENRDMGLVNACSWYLDEGLVQIFCPESNNTQSFYDKGITPKQRIQNHVAYEKMVKEEIVERIKSNTQVGKVAMAGCSFGGYQAANFAFRHPEMCSHLFSMSGSFGIRSFLEGYEDEDVISHSPLDYLQDLKNPILENLDIVLGTSNWDICFDINIKLSDMLESNGIRHWLDVRKDQRHDWPLWKEMFPHYLSRIKFD